MPSAMRAKNPLDRPVYITHSLVQAEKENNFFPGGGGTPNEIHGRHLRGFHFPNEHISVWACVYIREVESVGDSVSLIQHTSAIVPRGTKYL